MPGPLLLPLPRSSEYELREGYLGVPAGFRTDGANIPRPLWPLLGNPFEPDLIAAALVHDQAYRCGSPSRREADWLFLAMLRGAGVGRLRSRLLWLGVRLFGWMYWRRCHHRRGIAG